MLVTASVYFELSDSTNSVTGRLEIQSHDAIETRSQCGITLGTRKIGHKNMSPQMANQIACYKSHSIVMLFLKVEDNLN